MYIHVDTRTLPPTVELCELEDVTGFRVVVQTAQHVWVEPEVVVGLADDPPSGWRESWAGMVSYAASRGWVDDAGRVRAHVDVTTS